MNPNLPTDRFYSALGEYLEKMDVYHHLRTTSTWGPSAKDCQHPRLDIADMHFYLIQDHDVPMGQAEVDQSVAVAVRLLGRYGAGSLASVSFDKGFTQAEDRALLSLYIPEVVMPKRGKETTEEAAHESEKKFVALRRAHSPVESDINALEHHGLNRCLDVGLKGYLRYVGFGVLAFNLHEIGRELLKQRRARVQTVRATA